MKSSDDVALAFRQARNARKLSMRDVEARARELWEQDPARFDLVSRGTISNIENEGRDFFDRPRHMTASKLRSIIEILWSGDTTAFTAATSIVPRLIIEQDGQNAEVTLPLYAERGEADPKAMRTGMSAIRRQTPVLPGADLLLEITSARNSPVLYPGQVIGVAYSSEPRLGAMNVVLRDGRIDLAWMVRADPLFAFTNVEEGPGLFKLRSPDYGDAVIGYVVWMQPHFPVMKELQKTA
jgi:transcriptional regulator with XRE-family HTH domain